MSAAGYFEEEVCRQLDELTATQGAALQKGAEWLCETLLADRWLFLFGTGHSHLLALEAFYRAGGLVRAVPILHEKLMLHVSASQSTEWERREGLAEELLTQYQVAKGDSLWVISNSGRNPVPIEMALGGKARGARVVAITNRAHAEDHPSRHASGKKLGDVADLVLDNCGVSGDAAVRLDHTPWRVGPTSTMMGSFIIQYMVVAAIDQAVQAGWDPEIYCSSNGVGEEHNALLLEKYRGRIPHL